MMQLLDLTLPSPAENLALDEALLESAEEEDSERESLRIWELPQPVVVVGRSSRIEKEVNEHACIQRDIPILRRSSGGAAIVAGPGCLMYALVLSLRARPELKDIGRAHAFVLNRLRESLAASQGKPNAISRAGTSDLVIRDDRSPSLVRKFSGNSLRMKRTHLLYHGTLLYGFDLSLISECLLTPPRQPEYRGVRSHREFVANLPAKREQVVNAVTAAWQTESELAHVPLARVAELVSTRFSRKSWNYEFA
jgi:lipoate-protein ligase A